MNFNFDPSALIPLGKAIAKIGLPFLPSLLNDVVPFPLSLLTGPAVNAIMAALGIDASAPDALAQAAAKIEADPNAAKTALQPVEDQHAALAATAESQYEATLKDVQDARATELKYVQAGSPIQYGAVVVSALAIILFGGVAILAMLGYGNNNPSAQWVVGAGISGWTAVLGYWIGSSKGSSDKTDALVNMAKQPQVIQGPGSHVSGGVDSAKKR